MNSIQVLTLVAAGHSHEKHIQEDSLHGIVPNESTEIWIVDDTRVNSEENKEPAEKSNHIKNQITIKNQI